MVIILLLYAALYYFNGQYSWSAWLSEYQSAKLYEGLRERTE